MSKRIEHVHWTDAPDMWMPYAPAIKVTGGTTVYLAGVTAAPVYHHHPHRPAQLNRPPQRSELVVFFCHRDSHFVSVFVSRPKGIRGPSVFEGRIRYSCGTDLV